MQNIYSLQSVYCAVSLLVNIILYMQCKDMKLSTILLHGFLFNCVRYLLLLVQFCCWNRINLYRFVFGQMYCMECSFKLWKHKEQEERQSWGQKHEPDRVRFLEWVLKQRQDLRLKTECHQDQMTATETTTGEVVELGIVKKRRQRVSLRKSPLWDWRNLVLN